MVTPACWAASRQRGRVNSTTPRTISRRSIASAGRALLTPENVCSRFTVSAPSSAACLITSAWGNAIRPADQDLAAADEHGEQVVEVVRHAAGQLAQRP